MTRDPTMTTDLSGDYSEAPILQRTLHDEVAARLRDMIVEGRIDPGSRINEVQLGRSLGVSRTPLREALKTLASEGLVDLVRNKGAIVRTFAIGETLDMVQALSAIEQTCSRLACDTASAEEIENFCSLTETMVSEYGKRNRLAYFKLNQQLHQLLVDLAGNQTLSRFHRTTQEQLRRVRFIDIDKADIWALATSQHEGLAVAFRSRDKSKMGSILEDHLVLTLQRLREATHANEL
ncbi:GntR family transcriptional regulator [Corticibacterium sp. UT-5YL-CI-8]|nr:GntR family transcriptional regulator [Tianweitania sp. UT-5YL-CI-8]